MNFTRKTKQKPPHSPKTSKVTYRIHQILTYLLVMFYHCDIDLTSIENSHRKVLRSSHYHAFLPPKIRWFLTITTPAITLLKSWLHFFQVFFSFFFLFPPLPPLPHAGTANF